MDFRASGVRSLKLNIFLILKEVKTNLILRSASQKRLSNCRSLSSAILECSKIHGGLSIYLCGM